MGETISNAPLTTVGGNYYHGLTRTTAKEQGLNIILFEAIDANDG